MEPTSTCSAPSVVRSMHASHATTPSRRVKIAVIGAPIGWEALSSSTILSTRSPAPGS